MKISIWVTVSDLVSTRQTLIEKAIEFFDKKQTMFHSYPHGSIFQSLNRAGVEGIELLIPLHTSDKNIEDVKKIMDKNNMPIFSIHQSLSNRHTISLTEIEKLCRIANMFSASIVVLHSATLGKRLRNADFINNLKSLQRKHTIIFSIENMDRSSSPAESFTYKGKDFASVVKKAGFSMTFDVTHLAQVGEDIINFYLTNKEWIVNIHISDYKKTWLNTHLLPQVYSHLALNKGELPIEKFLKILKKENYKGLITMEINAGIVEFFEGAKIIRQVFSQR